MNRLRIGRQTTAWLITSLLAASAVGCGEDARPDGGTDDAGGAGGGSGEDETAPQVDSTVPLDDAIGVARNRSILVIFNEAMAASTIDESSIVVTDSTGAEVPGNVTYAANTATFVPSSELDASLVYTITVDHQVTDVAGNPLAADFVWSFTTGTTSALGPMPVNLGLSGNYVLLAKAGISATTGTAIVGNVGVSPAAESSLTGFGQTRDATNQFSTSSFVEGRLEASDMAQPTPATLTTAIGNMETAYTDAAGRTLPDFTEEGAGDVSGLTLVPGLYKWSSGVLITSDVTLAGGANDVWIFQIAQDLTLESDVQVTLSGGARPENIFWQVAGQAVIGTGADLEGNILGQTQIVLETGAVLHGRALAQTAVTLDANSVSAPAP